MIKKVGKQIEKDFKMSDNPMVEVPKAKRALLTEVCHMWSQVCSKIAIDSFNRHFCLVLPPALLAAVFLYVSERYLLRLKLFS